MSAEHQELIYMAARKLAKKHGIKLSEALAVCRSQFQFTADVMRQGEFKGILVAGIGTFLVNWKRVVKYDNRKLLRQRYSQNLLKK